MTLRIGADHSLSVVFERCRRERRAAFIPFVVAGDPDAAATVDIIAAACDGGADIVEIGIPYSDPLADGPTIQEAAHRAIVGGMTFDRALELARRTKNRLPATPLVGFTYYNPVFTRGIVKTAEDFAAAGFDGIIVPDLPLGEATSLLEAFHEQGLAVTLLVAPTTPDDRAQAIAALCTDFVYVVSRLGVTGAGVDVGEIIRSQVARLRALTNKPLAVGFGVASAADVALIASFADGVIVGSALIDRVAAAPSVAQAVEDVRQFCSEISSRCCQEILLR
jgi:tryptophan synthase alpha chain